jgi:transcription antitermination factor NusG
VEDNEKCWFRRPHLLGYEERVKKNLEQRIKFMDVHGDISQVVIPTENEVEVKSGQRRNIVKKILPSYVLVEMKMNDQSWDVVRNTPGVTGFVSSDNSRYRCRLKKSSRYETDGSRDPQSKGRLPSRTKRQGTGWAFY